MAETVQITGLTELRRKLAQAGNKAMPYLMGAMNECAEDIRTKALPLTPRSPHGGNLRTSVKNYGVERSGSALTLTMGAGGAGMDYAIAVHEHPSEHSPPSWLGKSINWSEAGTGPKFLQKPFKTYKWGPALARKIGRKIEQAIARG